MSYDIFLEINTGGPEPATVEDVGNMTWNVGPMFAEALGIPLRELDGMRCDAALDRLDKAVADMEEHEEKYTPMNPANGWGDYYTALAYLKKLRDACCRHPLAAINVG